MVFFYAIKFFKYSKFLLFVKSDEHSIGNGFISLNAYFTAYLLKGINKFLKYQ